VDGWSKPHPGSFTRGKVTRYTLYRRLGGPQGWSGRVRKISPPPLPISPAFQPRTLQPVESRYTDWITSVFSGRYKTVCLKCVQIPLVRCGLIFCYIIYFQVYALTWHLLVFLTTVSAVTLSGFGLHKDGQRIDVDEEAARKYLEYLENEIDRRANRASLARWAYTSNMTEETLKNQVRKYGKSVAPCWS
jgi:hypothetical protein